MNDTSHELRHQLAIAVATIEALIDGKLEPTQRRFRTVSHALGEIDALLEQFDPPYRALPDSQIAEICTIIGNEILAIESATRSGTSTRTSEVIRDLLLNAIRYAPPGGTIAVECRPGFDKLALSISQQDLGSAGAGSRAITIDRREGEATTFTVRL